MKFILIKMLLYIKIVVWDEFFFFIRDGRRDLEISVVFLVRGNKIVFNVV